MPGRLMLVFFISLVCFLPFNGSLPVTDPVEANYALTAQEMLFSGDWISPQIYGQYWFDKPILIYWLIAGSYMLLGMGEFAARFPAGVFAAASVTLVYWSAVRVYANHRVAFFAALALASGLEFWVLAKMIITDAVLMFWVSGVMVTLYLSLQNRHWQTVAGFCAGMAVLTKGPVGVALPALTVLLFALYRRDGAALRRFLAWPGLVAFLLTAVPWYGIMYRLHGMEFINTFLGLHNYLRATVSEHPKDNVFYYYLVLFPVSLLPWTGVFFRGLGGLWREGRSVWNSYLLWWMGVIIVFYSLMATKYPTYVFPAAFPAALITGWMLERMQREVGQRQWLWLLVPLLLLLGAMGVGLQWLPETQGVSAAVSILLTGGVSLWMQWTGRKRWLPVAAAVTVFIVSLSTVYGGLIPLAAEKSAKKLAQELPYNGAVIASCGDYSTSFVFYSRYRVPRLVDRVDSAAVSVWAGKNTMPVETWEQFRVRAAGAADVYVLRKERGNTSLPVMLAQGWTLVDHNGEQELWRRETTE
ncbi:MAG TPA: glycosyltransferase family 39 protein [Patescibacteria group bacterium]|nr:glycosyltransferase family 39 protein [Patescibacteria group bacterium]